MFPYWRIVQLRVPRFNQRQATRDVVATLTTFPCIISVLCNTVTTSVHLMFTNVHGMYTKKNREHLNLLTYISTTPFLSLTGVSNLQQTTNQPHS